MAAYTSAASSEIMNRLSWYLMMAEGATFLHAADCYALQLERIAPFIPTLFKCEGNLSRILGTR